MSTFRRNLGLSIEGMGNDVSSTAGIMWNFGRPTISVPGDYEWEGGLGTGSGLSREPASVAVSVDEFECELRGNGHTFELHGTNLAKSLFLSRPLQPRDALNAAITATATTIVFSVSGTYTWSASDDNTVVWFADEAILLGAFQAGGTFTGCTRGMFSTTAMDQPAGLNVYNVNPKIENRLARLWVYDRDAGSTTMAWQGFVQRYEASGPTITVQCQDIWTAVASSGATVNRGNAKGTKRVRSTATPNDPAAPSTIQGSVRFDRDWPDATGKRVNKENATSPHWMAAQKHGALFFFNLNAAVGNAQAEDNGAGAGSDPQLGSTIDEYDARDAFGFELLVVDRFKDQDDGTNAAYADFRSSTRDLDEPFHPVSISMALLTSTYATQAGLASFGDTWAIVESSDYYTSGALVAAEHSFTVPGDDDVLLFNTSPGSEGMVRAEPSGGGTAVWNYDVSSTPSLEGSGAQRLNVTSDGTFGFLAWRSGGTTTRVGRCALTDGLHDWNVTMTVGGPRCLTVDSSSLVYGVVSGAANACETFDGTAISSGAANSSVVSFTLTSDGTTKSAVLNDDETALFHFDTNGDLHIRLISGKPGSGAWAVDTTVDLSVDPSTPWGAVTGDGKLVASRNVDRAAVWICNASNDTVYKFDSDGTELAVCNPESDLGLSGATVAGIDCDSFGFLYVAIFTGSATHVAKYNSGGGLVTSTVAQSITLPTTTSPLDISVGDTTGVIWLTNAAGNGFLTEISVS